MKNALKQIAIAIVILIGIWMLLPFLVPIIGAAFVGILRIILIVAAMVWIIRAIP